MEPRSTTCDLITADDFYRQPDDDLSSELVAGQVIREPPPGWEHGLLAVNVAVHLRRFLDDHPLGRISVESGCVLARDPDTVRAPDVSFVSEERWVATGATRSYLEGAPDLAVEIASPGDRLGKLEEKARDYLRAGAQQVWVVWPESRTNDVHRPDAPTETLTLADTLDGGDVLPGLALPVRRFFDGRPR